MDRTRTVRSNRVGTVFFLIGSAALLLGVIARGVSAGRAPLGNMYEFSISGALTFALAYLLIGRKYDLRWLGLPIALLLLIILGTAVTLLYRPSAPLVPALQSIWLVIHVAAAVTSGGIFLLSNAVASTYLWLDKVERKGERSEFAKRFPSLEVLDQLSYRMVAFVFPLWTFAIIAGAIWAEAAWGRYWGWDPKETWSFITWILYAAYLHARVTAGWKGRKAAWLSLIAGSSYLFNYVYINVWGTGRHTYSGL
jgi:cytochrome c-type biogenesis protein CcsB